MSVRRRDGRIWFVMLGVFVAVFLFTFLVQSSKREDDVLAASLAGFDPGYIISDYQMSNYNSMSEAEIQAFLTAKNSCNNRDYDYYLRLSAGGNNIWHWSDGHFVCLSEERFGDGEVIGSGDTAAHIIWQTAQDYRINPQVLIVLLQKETGLITDPIPNSFDYRKAAGYGCPDTAACSSKYYGFKNQIRNAAALFRTVLDGGWTNYPLGENYIQYNPNASCGGSVVNIRSLATSALYRYTPYQPNEGALAAGYGTAYCGAYGNRNFYLYFEDWFGGVTLEKKKRGDVYIVEGDYEIVTGLADNKVLDIAGNGSGRNVQISDRNGSDAQKWHVRRNDDGTYGITSFIDNRVLDVEGGSEVRGGNAQVYAQNGTCAQKWKIKVNSDNSYVIMSACSDLALDVVGANASNGTNVQIYDDNVTSAQKWSLKPARSIGDGTYSIETALSKSVVIDIAGGAGTASDGTNVQVYESNNTGAQMWTIRYEVDGYYSIVNPVNGKSLNIVKGGINVQLDSYTGACEQKWQIVDNRAGSYEIVAPCSGMKVSLAKNSVENGNNVLMASGAGGQTQLWNFERKVYMSEGQYEIVAASAWKAVDVAGGTWMARNGTNIQLYDRNGTGAQKWYLRRNSDNTYTIFNMDTGKVLDVLDGGRTNNTNVQLYAHNGTCAQRWELKDNGDETYVILSACSGLALDVREGYMANGANIQLYMVNNSAAQKWKFVR